MHFRMLQHCRPAEFVLGGIQSLHTTPYLEPISLPTPKSHELAIRTQQILDYEVGAANVADPLGGSYYVEYLTDKIEEQAEKIILQIEELGGILEAHKKGWVYAEVEKTAHKIQEEIESGEVMPKISRYPRRLCLL